MSRLSRIIPEKTTLTKQQITAIKGHIAEGTPWVVRDCEDTRVMFFEDEPVCSNNYFFISTLDNRFTSYTNSPLYDFVTFKNSPVYLPDLIEEWE